jgi:hypothetical protein
MTTTTTEKKLARALRACLEVLDDLPPCAAAGHAAKLGHEALAAHEADKQRESVDEREAFEAWVEREAGPGADQDNRAGWVACLNWQAGRASAQAVPADQPAVQQRTQHDADSAELRSLCQARDHARRERDSLRAELAGAMSASGHLSSLVDDLRGLLAESMRVMKALHESATPDDGPDMDAIIPAGAFRQFVDDNAKLMHLIHVSPHELPAVPAWQPIESAPRDGTMFLCWVSAVRYGETDEGQQYQQDASQADFCWWRDGHGYFDPACGQIGDSQDVTHWMPLPAAPKGD